MFDFIYGEEIEGEKLLLHFYCNYYLEWHSSFKNPFLQPSLKVLLKVDFRKIKNTSKYANGYKHSTAAVRNHFMWNC